MSAYIEALIIYILCACLYITPGLDTMQIILSIGAFTIMCFQFIVQSNKSLTIYGILSVLICIFQPDFMIFLPVLSYIPFYKKSYTVVCVNTLLLSFSFIESLNYVNHYIFIIHALSLYLAYRNCKCQELKQAILTLRDNSVEKENILKKDNAHLIASQNDEIYIATLQERNRIAREIHDNVGHMLSRSILQLGALLAICKDDTLKPHLQSLKDTLDTAMNNIRESVHDLHDESVDLEQSIRNMVEEFSFCPIDYTCDISKRVPKEIKYCFIAITKEALHNVIKHSNASKVTIFIKEHPGFYQLLIEDNGTSSKNGDGSGIGLSNMEDRVKAIRGPLHISTEKGYRIFISVPK